MEKNEELELEVRRILATEVESHRAFLQSQFRNLTWGIGILFTVGAIIFTFLFGKSIDESKEQLVSTIDAKVVDYRIVESFKKRLDEFIKIAVDSAVNDEKTRKKIDEQLDLSTKNAVSRAANDIDHKLATAMTERVTSVQSLNATEIIRKVSLPSGAVLSFNRGRCPPGWREYGPAYGRFIRGIDRSGSIDPDGVREVGSVQDDVLKKHSHTVSISRADTKSVGRGLLPYFEQRNFPEVRTSTEGEGESRPKNVALLYCEKA
ncbi:MAG: hypothetical protein MJE77_41815 [Proteobacteria bacterium]|nr:hypothetical protein [Pseudomonadota bacterium]